MMPRQRKLFQKDEREAKELKKQQRAREERSREREIEREREKRKKLNRKPKSEFYECACGIKLHWRVAYGHKSGCPQCHKPINLSDIFEEVL